MAHPSLKGLFLLAFFLFCGRAAAQVPAGIKRVDFVDLPSAAGQVYRLFVSLPDDYAQSGRSYPVVYVLDADFNFLHLANLYRQLVRSDGVPEAILIGIGYGTVFLERGNNRWRDFSPTFLPKYPGSGGAKAFKEFLSGQLKPSVAKQYRTAGASTIHGHSMAGLFLTYLLFEQPDLFDQYLITSPALWWDEKQVFKYEKRYHAAHQDLKAKLFLTVGGREGKNMRKDWATLRETLQSRGYAGLIMETRYYPDQSHIEVIPGAFADGMRYLCGSDKN
jgi:predicted alpha/beta superfamily hydrolase